MEELRLTKEIRTLTIDPEFRDLIPPLSEAEFNLLEESIVANGCESPLIVWNGTIVDGHNRYDVCQKHDIPFAVLEKPFMDRNAALMWMIQTQLGRRNLTAYQKGELALRFEPLLKTQAKERLVTSTGGNEPRPVKNSAQAGIGEKTRDKVADIAGVSHDTIQKVKKLAASADEETKQRLRRGDVSINKAYSALMHKEHEDEVKTCERCKQEKPVSDFNIPSNCRGFSSLCKQCEAEINKAAKAAAEVASQTTEPVETQPISTPPTRTLGDPRDTRAVFSTVGDITDIPENFPNVMGLFERYVNSFVCGVQYSLHQYKPSMISEEHNAQLRALIAKSQEALDSFDAYVAHTKTKENGGEYHE